MKTLQELKRAIQNKQLDISLLVLKWSDVSFIAYEYLHAIAEFKKLEINHVEDFDYEFQTNDTDMFNFSSIDYLQLYAVDKFTTKLIASQLKELENVIVICKEVDDGLLEILKQNEMHFEIPKLKDWQVIDYLRVSCSGLSVPKIQWLYNVTGGNVYRLDNEIKKISCFDRSFHEDAFDMINADNGYEDLTQNKIYDLSNAILSRDVNQMRSILKDIQSMDVEGVGLITILRRSFKIVIGIQLDSNATAEKLGIKQAQFNVVRAKNCGKYSTDKLKQVFKFLTDFDVNLKSGNLDMSKDRLIDYIICEVMS